MIFGLAFMFVATSCSLAAERLPASMAGQIEKPAGRIAFIRESNIWMINVDSGNASIISDIRNADGGLSWAPDGKRIAYTRSGQVNLQTPQNDGGIHKVYDIFIAFLDSAESHNLFYWEQLTTELGSRDPQWSADGKSIIYSRDLFANTVNATTPNYQICTINPDGTDSKILRKDWRNLTDLFVTPTMNKNGDIAFVLFYDQRTQGIAVLNQNDFMVSLDSIRTAASAMADMVGPAWSPDGKWLAYMNNQLSDGGLYITTPDLKKHYLVHQPVGTSLSARSPSWSPDSKWLTFSASDGSIWITDITGKQAKRLTNSGSDWAPAWSK